MRFLRQSTAVSRVIGPFPDPTTGAGVTTLTSQAGRLTKAGAGMAFTPASWTHDYGGHYLVGFASGDVDTVGSLRVAFDSAAYLPVWEDFTVLSPAVYDFLFGTNVPNDASIAAAVFATIIEGSTTFLGSIRLINAAAHGESTQPATGKRAYRDLANSKNRIIGDTDSAGNRSNITRDPS